MSKKIRNMSVEEFAKTISKRINELYDKTKFKTQEELVGYINETDRKISHATVSVVKSGNHNVSAYNLALIIEAMGGSLDQIIFGKEQKVELADFALMLDRARKESVAIQDKEIRDIVLALTELRESDMGFYETMTRLFKLSKKLDRDRINAMNIIIDVFLKEIDEP